jgi:hypothetical protein
MQQQAALGLEGITGRGREPGHHLDCGEGRHLRDAAIRALRHRRLV